MSSSELKSDAVSTTVSPTKSLVDSGSPSGIPESILSTRFFENPAGKMEQTTLVDNTVTSDGHVDSAGVKEVIPTTLSDIPGSLVSNDSAVTTAVPGADPGPREANKPPSSPEIPDPTHKKRSHKRKFKLVEGENGVQAFDMDTGEEIAMETLAGDVLDWSTSTTRRSKTRGSQGKDNISSHTRNWQEFFTSLRPSNVVDDGEASFDFEKETMQLYSSDSHFRKLVQQVQRQFRESSKTACKAKAAQKHGRTASVASREVSQKGPKTALSKRNSATDRSGHNGSNGKGAGASSSSHNDDASLKQNAGAGSVFVSTAEFLKTVNPFNRIPRSESGNVYQSPFYASFLPRQLQMQQQKAKAFTASSEWQRLLAKRIRREFSCAYQVTPGYMINRNARNMTIGGTSQKLCEDRVVIGDDQFVPAGPEGMAPVAGHQPLGPSPFQVMVVADGHGGSVGAANFFSRWSKIAFSVLIGGMLACFPALTLESEILQDWFRHHVQSIFQQMDQAYNRAKLAYLQHLHLPEFAASLSAGECPPCPYPLTSDMERDAWKLATSAPVDDGTTLLVALSFNNWLMFAHVGDSRGTVAVWDDKCTDNKLHGAREQWRVTAATRDHTPGYMPLCADILRNGGFFYDDVLGKRKHTPTFALEALREKYKAHSRSKSAAKLKWGKPPQKAEMEVETATAAIPTPPTFPVKAEAEASTAEAMTPSLGLEMGLVPEEVMEDTLESFMDEIVDSEEMESTQSTMDVESRVVEATEKESEQGQESQKNVKEENESEKDSCTAVNGNKIQIPTAMAVEGNPRTRVADQITWLTEKIPAGQEARVVRDTYVMVENPVVMNGVAAGKLNMSSSMGNVLFKLNAAAPVISCIPEVSFTYLPPDQPCLLVMATDGFWNYLPTEAKRPQLQNHLVVDRIGRLLSTLLNPAELDCYLPTVMENFSGREKWCLHQKAYFDDCSLVIGLWQSTAYPEGYNPFATLSKTTPAKPPIKKKNTKRKAAATLKTETPKKGTKHYEKEKGKEKGKEKEKEKEKDLPSAVEEVKEEDLQQQIEALQPSSLALGDSEDVTGAVQASEPEKHPEEDTGDRRCAGDVPMSDAMSMDHDVNSKREEASTCSQEEKEEEREEREEEAVAKADTTTVEPHASDSASSMQLC
jgi:serine/threonine protein phosphatase PrpC